MDPICVDDEETLSLKKKVGEYINEIDSSITMHDFRIVKGPTHTNVIFDIVVPYDFSTTDEQLVKIISDRIKQENPNHYAVIEVDKQYAQL